MYDVAIVGAGSAGCVLAARLSEDPGRSVLLLEAGPDYATAADLPPDVRSALNPTTTHDWGYASEASGLVASIPLPRGKLVGGCSATNAAFALRGAPSDYDEWADLGNAGWSFDEVLPFFRRLERDLDFGTAAFHGRDGPLPIRRYATNELVPEQLAFLEACAERGYAIVEDHNAPGSEGAGRLPVNAIDGVRENTALTYLARARERTNLSVRAGVHIDCVTFDGERATGIRTAGGEVIEARQVILSAGAYNSPAILLRSGVGAADELRALGIRVAVDLPGVGRNLIDHPRLRVRFAATPHAGDVVGCQTVLTLRSSATATGYDLHVFPWSVSRDGVFALHTALMKPKSAGRVRLRTRDPMERPSIDCGFFTDPTDLPRLAHAVRAARDLARATPLAAVVTHELYPGPTVGDSDAELGAAIRADARTYFHPVGTCRMGSDADAVVDERGNVRGCAGLSVIDASVMPTIPAANTNVPTIMVAERCAAYPATPARARHGD